MSDINLHPYTTAGDMTFDWEVFFKYGAPAAMYFTNNLVLFAAVHLLSAASWQILSQVKIIFTAVAFTLWFQRPMKSVEQMSIELLFLGCVLSQAKDLFGMSVGDDHSLGYVLVLVYSVVSACATIATEHLLKNVKQHFMFQNLQMYFWGGVFATLMSCGVSETITRLQRGEEYEFCIPRDMVGRCKLDPVPPGLKV